MRHACIVHALYGLHALCMHCTIWMHCRCIYHMERCSQMTVADTVVISGWMNVAFKCPWLLLSVLVSSGLFRSDLALLRLHPLSIWERDPTEEWAERCPPMMLVLRDLGRTTMLDWSCCVCMIRGPFRESPTDREAIDERPLEVVNFWSAKVKTKILYILEHSSCNVLCLSRSGILKELLHLPIEVWNMESIITMLCLSRSGILKALLHFYAYWGLESWKYCYNEPLCTNNH